MNLLFKILLVSIATLLLLFLLDKTTGLDVGLEKKLMEVYLNFSRAEDDDNSEADEERGEDADYEHDERIRIVDGYKAIEVDEDVISTAGIRFANPESRSFIPEFTAHAEVMDIAPLVAAKSRYINLQAEIKVLQSDLYNHNLALKRAEALHKTKSLSTRELEKHRADRDLKASELGAINTRLENLVYDIKSEWGGEIARLVLDKDNQAIFDQLSSHKTALIQVSLLKDNTLDNIEQKVYVSNRNQRDTALEVTYLDQATHVNNQLHGESYIYLLESEKFRPGNRLFAWIEESGDPLSGLFIPESAVIWYANEAWIYIKHDDQLFVRKPLQDARKLANGWMVQEGVGKDELIVSHGGQTLLSEEFKWAIPDEDDD